MGTQFGAAARYFGQHWQRVGAICNQISDPVQDCLVALVDITHALYACMISGIEAWAGEHRPEFLASASWVFGAAGATPAGWTLGFGIPICRGSCKRQGGRRPRPSSLILPCSKRHIPDGRCSILHYAAHWALCLPCQAPDQLGTILSSCWSSRPGILPWRCSPHATPQALLEERAAGFRTTYCQLLSSLLWDEHAAAVGSGACSSDAARATSE